ncbi:MAG: hypothetical protein ACQESR_07195 [Planctomycetota bacterium]
MKIFGSPTRFRSGIQVFPAEYSGTLFPTNDGRYGRALAVYVDSQTALKPETRYRITVTAESVGGARLPDEEQSWHFTTEAAPTAHPVEFDLDLAQDPDVQWRGEFFNSLAKSAFRTSSRGRLPHYDLIAEARKEFPRAWNLQRDTYLSGFEHQPNPFKMYPNIVREKETRRITRLTRKDGEVLLHVEDFLGHEQYGIESNRPLSEDYRPDEEVLVADGVDSVRAFVIATHDAEGVVRVTAFEVIRERARLRVTAASTHRLGDDGGIHLPVRVSGNGTNFVMVTPYSH